jgi:aminopeptidase-like protein
LTVDDIVDLVRRLYPFAYSVVGKSNDDSLSLWLAELPFKVHEYPSGDELNGWLIPPAWSVLKAQIHKNGELLYDATRSPLGVATLSQPFQGRLTLAALRPHLFFSDTDADAVVYHWGALYRNQDEGEWGICMPRRLVERLTDGEYDVEIATRTEPSTMKVLDYHLPGHSARTILLNGHNCHPFQANDDISGCAVGIAVMKRLAALPQRRYSYRLLVAPELIGTMFWLHDLGDESRDTACAILLKSVGNGAPLRLQESFTGRSRVDRAAHHVFRNRYGDYASAGFRKIHGNDETVFEAPGYEIPSICLTRWPFEQYHTDKDTPETLSEDRLRDTAEAAFDICMALESDIRLKGTFTGLVRLSDPRYDLYRPAAAPGLQRREHTEEMARWNWLMNCLPRHLDGRTGLLEVAQRYGLPIRDVHDYAMKWVDRGLAEVVEGSPDEGCV